MLGTIERERAYSTVHEGAIYLHLGESYRVVALDLVARSALVEPFAGDYYTQAKKETMTSIEETLRTEPRLGLELAFGRVSVTEQVVGYQRKSIRDQSTLELVGLDLPETTFDTEAVWYVPEPEQLDGLTDMPKLLGTLHAAEHAMIAILPLWAMCDRWDIGGLSTNIHFQTGRPTVFVYDGHSGGVGITERGLRDVRGLGRGHREDARRLPVRERLPVLRPVAEVREPERAARQGRGARAARPYARRVIQTMTAPLRRVFVRRPRHRRLALARVRLALGAGCRAAGRGARGAVRRRSRRRAPRSSSASPRRAETSTRSTSSTPRSSSDAGAILLRPGKESRRDEVAAMRADFEANGVPIAAELTAPALAEGGDTLWLDETTLVVGLGYRTNATGAAQIAVALPEVDVLTVDLPHHRGRGEVLHLLSLISPLDDDLALVYLPLLPVRLVAAPRGARACAWSRCRTRSSSRWAATCSRWRRGSASRSTATRRRAGAWKRQASTSASTRARSSRARATAARRASRVPLARG